MRARRSPLSALAERRTPVSVLDGPAAAAGPAYFIGERSRWATCGAVAWLGDDHLLALNLLGEAIDSYRFDARTGSLDPVGRVTGLSGVRQPEQLVVAPDGRSVVVTSSLGGTVTVHAVDPVTRHVEPEPSTQLQLEPESNPHGVAFTPDGTRLLLTTVNQPAGLRVHATDPGLPEVQRLDDPHPTRRPKGVAVAPDGRHVAVCHGPNGRIESSTIGQQGHVALHRFDPEVGIDPVPIARSDDQAGLVCAEDVTFAAGGTRLLVTDQATDAVAVLAVDEEPTLRKVRTRPLAGLRFPHGLALSSDERYLAIASYGDDHVRVFDTARCLARSW